MTIVTKHFTTEFGLTEWLESLPMEEREHMRYIDLKASAPRQETPGGPVLYAVTFTYEDMRPEQERGDE